MATLVAITVDTGGTGDYPSLNAAEAANWGAGGVNITAAGTDEYVEVTCQCTDGNADTTYADCNGMTTDSTHTITVDVDASYRHSGTFPASGNIYRMTNSLNNCIRCQDNYITFRHIAVQQDSGASYKYGIMIYKAQENTVEYCIAKGNASATTENCSGFFAFTIYGTVYFANNIAYDFSTSHATKGHGFGIDPQGAHTVYLHHNTAVNCDTGIEAAGGTVVAKNNLCFNNTVAGDYVGSFDAASTNNGYTTGQSGPTGGSNAIDLGSAASSIFRDEANDDYRIYDTSTAYQVGTDLSGDPNLAVTDDIEGDTRSATPSIGAEEGTSVPGTMILETQREQMQPKISKWALEGLLQKYAYHP